MVRQVALPCLTGPFDILWKVKYSDTTLPDRSEAQAWLLTFRAWIRTQSFLPQLSPLDHVKRGSVNLKKKKKTRNYSLWTAERRGAERILFIEKKKNLKI